MNQIKNIVSKLSTLSTLKSDTRGEGVIGKVVVLAMVLTAGVAAMQTVGSATEGKSSELGGLVGGLAHGGR
jgi:hypothetical protein